MRNVWWMSLLFAGVVWAQTKPAENKPGDAKAAVPSTSSVAPDTPVLTIKGLCDQPPQTAAAPCQTVVTRAQFENLVEALQPTMDQESKYQLGRAYPQFLVMAKEAQRRGLDKTQRFQERIDFARLQILSQELTRQLQQQAAEVPDKDINDYYQKNSRDFETANLERIVVPLRGAKDKPSAEEMKQLAETLRTRAAAGEDFSVLQKAAYDAAGVSGNTAPSPGMQDMRRRSLPPTQASAFDLKPGEVSPVISDTTGYYIYKMDSKGMVPLQSVQKEIWNTLRRERSQKMIEGVQQPFTTEINPAYFGTGHASDKD
jgi:hypothetical protein